ncbi:MAG: alkaline phosphatase PhoX, partial [Hyphomicrobiaceae bacterium]
MTRLMLAAIAAMLALSVTIAPPTGAAEPLVFTGVSVPITDKEKREVRTAETVIVDGRAHGIGYTTLLRSGDKVGSGVFGQILDNNGRPIKTPNGAPMISPATDFSSLIEKDGRLYIVSHFEARPAAVYVTAVVKDGDKGESRAVDTHPVDFSAFGGLWVPCAGSVTPWGTHLGSEENEPDARKIEDTADIAKLDRYPKPMALYFGYDAMDASRKPSMSGFRKVFNPYNYGYITEVTISEAGRGRGVKHHAMGRFSHELAYVMPDLRTVYMSDDGTNVGLFRFVADEPGRLDAGSLYAARWRQLDAGNGGTADLHWIDLGRATAADVKALVDKRTTFSDIFETAAIGDDNACPAEFTASVANGARECLRVKPGMALAASRLETRRYAALKGATVEFSKAEGLTFDPYRKRLYLALSQISSGMEDMTLKGRASVRFDLASANHVKIPYNACGGIYALDLDDDFVATSMQA